MIYESPTEFPIIVYVFAFHILRCALQKHNYMSTLSYLLKLVYPNVGDVHIGRPMCCLVRIQSYIWAISITCCGGFWDPTVQREATHDLGFPNMIL